MLKKIISLFLLVLSISSCSYDSKHSYSVTMENHFTLIEDRYHWFPDQINYFSFIKNAYIDTYYYPNEDGYTVHYHMEYVKDDIVNDDYGTYEIKDNTIYLYLNKLGKTPLTFNHNRDTTVDYLLIGYTYYEEKYYYLIFEADYSVTAKG